MTTDVSSNNTSAVTLLTTIDSSNIGNVTTVDYDYGGGFGNPLTYTTFKVTFLLIGCLGLIGNTFVIAVLVGYTKPNEKVMFITSLHAVIVFSMKHLSRMVGVMSLFIA
jgi:hypothetical protein